MTTLTISLGQLQLFLFVFVRVTAILMTLPVFSGSAVPSQLKIALAMAVFPGSFPPAAGHGRPYGDRPRGPGSRPVS